MTGSLNRKFGWLWLLLAPLMGMYITLQFQNVEGYGTAAVRTANRLFHAHVGILAFFNILYGKSIDGTGLAENTKKLGGYLAVVGTVLVSVSFLALLVQALQPIGFPSRILGFISILVAVLIMAVGELQTKK